MGYAKYLMICLMGMVILSFPSCDGIFDGIYDTPVRKIEVGFNPNDNSGQTGTLYVDASDYARWIYVDFHRQTLDTVKIDTTAANPLVGEPEHWDIALHRYDAKTNNGAVASTDFTDLKTFGAVGILPQEGYTADVEGVVTVDMSHMMDGYLVEVESPINKKLGEWLDVDTGSMPPAYTLSQKVYVVRLADQTHAALKLINFMNEEGDKGYMKIDYIYPLEAY